MKKNNKKLPLIAAIILAVVRAIVGISSIPDKKMDNAEKAATEMNDDIEEIPSSVDGGFMTEKEREEAQSVQEEDERLETEREEYLQNWNAVNFLFIAIIIMLTEQSRMAIG